VICKLKYFKLESNDYDGKPGKDHEAKTTKGRRKIAALDPPATTRPEADLLPIKTLLGKSLSEP